MDLVESLLRSRDPSNNEVKKLLKTFKEIKTISRNYNEKLSLEESVKR